MGAIEKVLTELILKKNLPGVENDVIQNICNTYIFIIFEDL